uniref:pentapeptide repeat-containing protein n=1 Tax=Enterobacter cloacae complex sp. 280C5 TaxID=3395861 RepID=UPI003CF7FAF4
MNSKNRIQKKLLKYHHIDLKNPRHQSDLAGSDLRFMDLRRFNLRNINLSGCNLWFSDLRGSRSYASLKGQISATVKRKGRFSVTRTVPNGLFRK